MSSENGGPVEPVKGEKTSEGMGVFLLFLFFAFAFMVVLPTALLSEHRTDSHGVLTKAYFLNVIYPKVVVVKEDKVEVYAWDGSDCETFRSIPCPPKWFEAGVADPVIRQALYERERFSIIYGGHKIVKEADGRVYLVRPRHHDLDMDMARFFRITPWMRAN